jgi:hypothetical protein
MSFGFGCCRWTTQTWRGWITPSLCPLWTVSTRGLSFTYMKVTRWLLRLQTWSHILSPFTGWFFFSSRPTQHSFVCWQCDSWEPYCSCNQLKILDSINVLVTIFRKKKMRHGETVAAAAASYLFFLLIPLIKSHVHSGPGPSTWDPWSLFNRDACRHGVRQLRTGWADGVPYITQCPIQQNQSYTHRCRV